MAERFTALVPMKGHSERIPGKNLRPLHDRPLCFHVLEVLSALPEVERIVVNTDSDEIAAACREAFAVTIHERPVAIRGDDVSMNLIIAHDLSLLPETDLFIQTHATNPLLTLPTVTAAMTAWHAGRERFDSLFSVTRHQSRFYDAGGRPLNHDPGELLRTQDLPPLLEENSCFYLFSRASFSRTGRRIGERPLLFAIDPLEAIDIDEESDWRLAEALLRLRAPDDGQVPDP